MVTVEFTKYGKGFCLVICGHAKAAPKGEDLVCCAASTLAYTAAQSALLLYEAGMLEHFPETKMDPGAAQVAAVATPEGMARVDQMFQTVCAGFDLLARQYPEHIQYVVHVHEFGDRA